MGTVTDFRPGEEGFTLVELLVAMTLSLIVLFATLQSFDVFTSNASQQTRATDANDQVRRDDGARRQRPSRFLGDPEGGGAGSRLPRPGQARLSHRAPLRRLGLPVRQLERDRSRGRRTDQPLNTATKLATLKSTTTTAFTYDGAASSATPALVKNVGLTIGLDASGGGRTATSTLRASAARRSASGLPITDDDLDTVCNPAGAFLSLNADVPNVGEMTVTYANDGGIAIGTPVTGGWQIPEGITNVVATVTDAAGVTNTIRKDVECSADEARTQR